MAIPMEIPVRFIQAVIDGRMVRHGCIIKDVASGQIVGHLKELSGLSRLLSSIPLNPILMGATAVAEMGQWIDTHVQLKEIKNVLHHLQLISSVGTVASVAGLGVSLAGFAIVMKRLDRLEQRLNQRMEKLRIEVERLHHRMDMLQMAELQAAWQQLAGASATNRAERVTELLKESDRTFQKYRNFYFNLIADTGPINRPLLSLAQVRELYGRLVACATAELEANFMLGDFPQWHSRHVSICEQLKGVCSFDPREAFAQRAAAIGLATEGEQKHLMEQVVAKRDFCVENQARIITAAEEIRWIDHHHLTPGEYLREFHVASDGGVVMVPHGVHNDGGQSD